MRRHAGTGALGVFTRLAAGSLLVATLVLTVLGATSQAQGPIPGLPEIQETIREVEQAGRAAAAASQSAWVDVAEQLPAVEGSLANAAAAASQLEALAEQAPQGAPAASLPDNATAPDDGDDGYLTAEEVAREDGWTRMVRVPPASVAPSIMPEQALRDVWLFPDEVGPGTYSQARLLNHIWQYVQKDLPINRHETLGDALRHYASVLDRALDTILGCWR